MKLFRRGQHADRLPIERKPAPPDVTGPIPRIPSELLQDPATVTFPAALPAPPRPRALTAPPMPPGWQPPGFRTPLPRRAPLHSPASMPPLEPAPPPARPRPAWTPPQPPKPPPPVRITEPALLACPGGVVPAVLTLPCGTCHRVHTRGATSSFRALYAEAARAGWQADAFGAWACPPCQARPGWRAPRAPVLVWSEHELIRDVASRKAPRWRVRRAFRNARVHLDAKKLRALRA